MLSVHVLNVNGLYMDQNIGFVLHCFEVTIVEIKPKSNPKLVRSTSILINLINYVFPVYMHTI